MEGGTWILHNDTSVCPVVWKRTMISSLDDYDDDDRDDAVVAVVALIIVANDDENVDD